MWVQMMTDIIGQRFLKKLSHRVFETLSRAGKLFLEPDSEIYGAKFDWVARTRSDDPTSALLLVIIAALGER